MNTASRTNLYRICATLSVFILASASALARNNGRDVLVITSTNSASGNDVAVFRLDLTGTPSLPLVNILPTGGSGGAAGNAGSVQFRDELGAVANYGSSNITRLLRTGDSIQIGQTIALTAGCTNPVSVSLADSHLYIAGANCAESRKWPSGIADGLRVTLPDTSAGQIVTGQTWAAVTMKSGTIVRLALTARGALAGSAVSIALPTNANDTPLGAAFWGDLLGFNAAHSPDSLVLVDPNRDVFPIPGPQPAYPTNAPCWLAKGPGNVWYAGNSPGHAISIFFSDAQGGAFYKSIPVPGVPTDITVSQDGQWLAVIYTASDGSGGRVAMYSIDSYGDLTLAATSSPAGVSAFNGVAISQ